VAAREPHHQVIDQSHPEELASFDHPPGEEEVFGAGAGVAARMGVEDEDPGGIAHQGLTVDRPRVDEDPIQGAPEELLLADHAVSGVEEEGSHDFLLHVAVAQAQVGGDVVGLAHRPALGQLEAGQAPAELDRGHDGGHLGPAEAFPAQIGEAEAGQAPEPPVFREDLATHFDRRDPGAPDAQEDGHQLGVGQGLGPMAQDPLPGTIVGGQLTDGRSELFLGHGGFSLLSFPLSTYSVLGALHFGEDFSLTPRQSAARNRPDRTDHRGEGTMIRFGEIEEDNAIYGTSRVALLPVPLERTTSYGQGTGRGPDALLAASRYLELYDEELGTEPFRQGIATLPAFAPREGEELGACLARLEEEARRHFAAGKFLAVIGGEHSLSAAPIFAARSVFGEIGVVQFDAHADLRDTYEGTPLSHACVMHRVVTEAEVPTLAVGIRSLSTPEAALIRERRLPVIWGHELPEHQAGEEERRRAAERFDTLLAALPPRIYLSFDIDYFDPALVPATGTPEPGGGTWVPTLALLRRLFRTKTVVGMDLVELAPAPGQPASDFLAAKLLYKCIAYLPDLS